MFFFHLIFALVAETEQAHVLMPLYNISKDFALEIPNRLVSGCSRMPSQPYLKNHENFFGSKHIFVISRERFGKWYTMSISFSVLLYNR